MDGLVRGGGWLLIPLLWLMDKNHIYIYWVETESEQSLSLTHIASFALFPSTLMVFTLKSTPRQWKASLSLIMSPLPHPASVPIWQLLQVWTITAKKNVSLWQTIIISDVSVSELLLTSAFRLASRPSHVLYLNYGVTVYSHAPLETWWWKCG